MRKAWLVVIGAVLVAGLLYFRSRGARVLMPGQSIPGQTLQDKILEYASMYSLDPDLVKAIAWQESRFNPNAINHNESGGTSSWGMMQIWYPHTANLLGFFGPPDNLLDIDINLDLACKLLRDICDRYNSLEDIIASYNAGSPKFDRSGNYINQAYVDSVLSRYRSYKGLMVV